jgi:uncharacterized protein
MNSPSNDNAAKRATSQKCPICQTPINQIPAADGYAPFCSRRCADVDLHRWLSGNYAIPAVEEDSDGALEANDEA